MIVLDETMSVRNYVYVIRQMRAKFSATPDKTSRYSHKIMFYIFHTEMLKIIQVKAMT